MNEHSSQFCQIAVDMRFVTAGQLTEALAEQAEDSFSNKSYRPIENIFFKNGWITNEQINFCLLYNARLYRTSLSKNA